LLLVYVWLFRMCPVVTLLVLIRGEWKIYDIL
jgi:hypothetical protein